MEFKKNFVKTLTTNSLPAILYFGLLFAPFPLYLVEPNALDLLLLLICFYTLYLCFKSTASNILGYFRYLRNKNINYLGKLNKTIADEVEILPKHLIVIPSYSETYSMLKASLDSVIGQNYPACNVFVSISFEERRMQRDEDYLLSLKRVQKEFGPILGNRLMISTHPEGITGEAMGAAANRTWCAKNAVVELKSRGEDISNFLVTSPDSDTVLDKNYLACASLKWIKDGKTKSKFYQSAIYTFNNNFWLSPLLIKVVSLGITSAILSGHLYKRKTYTFSCYTLSLELLESVDFWDVSLGIDDTTFYWRPYDYLKGEWVCEPLYVPIHSNAIYDSSYLGAHVAQFQELIRWSFGVITFPIAMKVLLTNTQIRTLRKLYSLYNLFEFFILLKALSFYMVFVMPIVLSLRSSEMLTLCIKFLSLSALSVPILLVFKYMLLAENKNMFEKVIFLSLETPLNVVVFIIYRFLPYSYVMAKMIIGNNHQSEVKWTSKVDSLESRV